jgi:hypothetical protein
MFVVALLSSSFAFAEDYSVDFGADADRGGDAGTRRCLATHVTEGWIRWGWE